MHMKKIKTRNPWTEPQVRQLVELYAQLLDMQLADKPFVKSHHVKRLAESQGRSTGSVEAKMMNVSAVLDQHGLDYIKGWKPLKNINKSLIDQVGKIIRLS